MLPAIPDYLAGRPARRSRRLEFAAAKRELLLESDRAPRHPFAIRPVSPFFAGLSIAGPQSIAPATPRVRIAAASTPGKSAESFPFFFLDQDCATNRTLPRFALMNLRMHWACEVNFSAPRLLARTRFRRVSFLVLHTFHTAHAMMHSLRFRRLKTRIAWCARGEEFGRLLCHRIAAQHRSGDRSHRFSCMHACWIRCRYRWRLEIRGAAAQKQHAERRNENSNARIHDDVLRPAAVAAVQSGTSCAECDLPRMRCNRRCRDLPRQESPSRFPAEPPHVGV